MGRSEKLVLSGIWISLISAYVFLSFVGLFALGGMRAEACRNLYSEIEAKLPTLDYETRTRVVEALPRFSWGFETELDFLSGLLLGLIGGLITAFASFLAIQFFNKRNGEDEKEDVRRAILVGVCICLIYLFSYVLASYFGSPFNLRSLLDMGLGFTYAGICSLVTYIFILRNISNFHREHYSLCTRTERWWELKLKQLELEHTGLTQFLHITTWGFIMMIIGVLFTTFYEYYFAVPEIIVYTNPFRFLIIPVFLWAVFIIVGIFGGIISQIISVIGDIVESLKKYEKHEKHLQKNQNQVRKGSSKTPQIQNRR